VRRCRRGAVLARSWCRTAMSYGSGFPIVIVVVVLAG
jgi:hypothetical protein